MSDNRKKSRRRRSIDDTPELTPIEKSIAKHLRFQCPTKKGILMGMQVVYFNGTKAVECLTESKWSSITAKALAGESTKDSKHPICFSSKHDAVQMLRKFLDNEMFRRVVKVYKEEKSSSEQTSSNVAGDTSQSNTPRAVRQRKTKSTATNESTTTTTTAKDDDSKEKDKGKKKKFKFELHDDQTFIDSINEFYVWIYSPTTIKQYIMGALLVIGCIGVCLFPLWPAEVRTGVYYLSMVLASLLGLLLSLAVIKYIIFAGVWLLTMGKIKFWLLPNLTEDVGFIESFIPLYTLDVTTKKKTNKTDEEKKENDEQEITNKKEDLNEENKTTIESNIIGHTESEQDDDDKEKTSRSSSLDEVDDGNKPQKSSDEDFEVLSKDELETK
ncbi:unnamed protein product [Rotaria sordida]|uniref:Translocation protein SEC62 n=1 Tax=Rotaria sordida TaxID=392033 RepID=A0A818T571_9BILA|nr:unnamed protein product [Rotaria sordida]CAF1157586.1 unnamed protein product [Rotaria sordida]CAF1318787.1 unnamed protein product [Rotaria sordida]CAF3673016.1 unnamed protein product [Rotaria sordida]CAF3678961.1 unnamed protein product [Rotaria sordida]